MKYWAICEDENTFQNLLLKDDTNLMPIICENEDQKEWVKKISKYFDCKCDELECSRKSIGRKEGRCRFEEKNILCMNISSQMLKYYFGNNSQYYSLTSKIDSNFVKDVVIVGLCRSASEEKNIRNEILSLQKKQIAVSIVLGRNWFDISFQLAKLVTPFNAPATGRCVINTVDDDAKEESTGENIYFNRNSNFKTMNGRWKRVYISAHGSGERLYLGTETVGFNNTCSIAAEKFFLRITGETLVINSCFSFSLKKYSLFWGLIKTPYKNIILYGGIKENYTSDIHWFQILSHVKVSCDYSTKYVNNQLENVSPDLGKYLYFGITKSSNKFCLDKGTNYQRIGKKIIASDSKKREIGYCHTPFAGYIESNKNIKWIYCNGSYWFCGEDSLELPKVIFVANIDDILGKIRESHRLLNRHLLTFPSNIQDQKDIFTKFLTEINITTDLTKSWGYATDFYKGINKLQKIRKSNLKLIEKSKNAFTKYALETNAPYSDKYLTNRFLCVKKENLKTKCNNCSSILQLKTFESIVDSSFKRMLLLCPICGQLTDSNNTKRDYPILNDNFITIDIDKKETYWITVIGYQIAKQQQLISSNFYTDQNSVKICVPKQFSRVSISINSEQEDSFITVSLGAR